MTWFRALAARLERTTLRERVLLGGFAIVGLVLALMSASGFRADQEDRFVEASATLDSARLTATTARRIQRASLDDAARRDLSDWGFKGDNLSVVRVRIEERVAAAAAAANLTTVAIVSADATEAEGPTQWLTIDLQADLMWTPLFAFLDDLASWPEGFRVLEFSYDGYQPPAPATVSTEGVIVQSGPPARVALSLSFPVVVPTEVAPS